jgi:SAM-dependent methyltransferase
MTPEDRLQTVRRYAERLQRLGPDVQALGWRDAEQQALRFDVLTGMLPDLAGARILDVGCGFGDLHEYLCARGIDAVYTGCDISADVLCVARARHAGLAFEERDIVDTPYPDGSFDYVCISGIFNHRITNNQAFMERTLSAAFRAARKGAAANMMTDHVDYREDHLYYFNPESVLAFCRTLSRHVALRHDYPLYEFTVAVRRLTLEP